MKLKSKVFNPGKKKLRFIPWWLILIYVIAAGAVSLDIYFMQRVTSKDNTLSQGKWDTPTPKATQTPVSTPTPAPETAAPTATLQALPASVLLDVPFLPQAPHRVWDALHKETCEEASLLMVAHFLNQEPAGTMDEIDAELKAMVAYEEANGYKVDLTMQELSQIAQNYLGLRADIIQNLETKDATLIKLYLAQGYPVIIPAAGRMLGNPNFTPPGPIYHNLVIKGYDQSGFISNDPGTWQGESYRYGFETIWNAIHDWNPTDILKGTPQILVVKKS